ncbi:7-cyano-7-deazaguanine synthase QueC [Desulfosporosinus sp. PR]|uniref:7-cyano-7-deazaguanine synthase QueC n=1 Tax=Candidatus Desulfosporosinus nitrosoreducens TaxID=3401928 RepID=UPI0027F4AA84|nr:7-cyano-7-deazaguanine synthase QueC [Desulfosporosinus sp. PR]MDQ7094009.1 7-cyano-7-deazaguanine synthase QueC [Desulfosporosinus sp. PR]
MAAIVLLSGGLDSAVSLALYLETSSIDLALTFDYGQRARAKEIAASRQIAQHYGIPHRVVSLPFLQEQTHSALVNHSHELPLPEYEKLDDVAGEARATAQQVWVPNRNGLFLNIAAVFAENMGEATTLITGFNREEAATFPDNSQEFMTALNRCFNYSTQNEVTVASPTARLDKAEIVREGLRLALPLEKIWSCYASGEQLCGQCESCLRLKRALLLNEAQELVDILFAVR